MTRPFRQSTIAACHKDAERQARFQWGQAVPLPVDCTDAEQFPEIALALAHARKLRETRNV